MKTYSHLSIFTMAVIFLALFLLAACQPTAAPQAAANHNADVERWVAMGNYYTVLSGNRLSRAESADQARWEAMGDYYLVYAGGRPLKAGQADQARWTAIGEYYSQPSATKALYKSAE
ncbi:MAG: hypothetical protein WAM60_04490 [Candidatus Promineifilaceae bacterium]